MKSFARYENLGGPRFTLGFPSTLSRDKFVREFPDNCVASEDGPTGCGHWKMAPRYGGSKACAMLNRFCGMIWEPLGEKLTISEATT